MTDLITSGGRLRGRVARASAGLVDLPRAGRAAGSARPSHSRPAAAVRRPWLDSA